MEPDNIEVTGAREHNLKSVTLSIPKKRFVVFTGPSGSGKSSLAIDTIYIEGRRRFVESLSAYARQFLGQKEKPRFEKIHGLSPTIAVEQKAASSNPRSTVGTITEILDYLRVLYARLGVQHCPSCGQAVSRQSAQQIVNHIAGLPERARVILLAPVLQNRKGEHKELLEGLRRQGLARVRLNGTVISLDELRSLDKRRKHTLEAVIDRLVIKDGIRARLTDSVETALSLGEGRLIAHQPDGDDTIYSERLACEPCARSFPDLSPQSFSFNGPQGMCHACNGLGHRLEIDPKLVVPDTALSLSDGALKIWKGQHIEGKRATARVLRHLQREVGLSLRVAFHDLPEEQQSCLLYGDAGLSAAPTRRGRRRRGASFEGIIPMLERRFHDTESEAMKAHYQSLMSTRPCELCGGLRLREASRHVLLGSHALTDLCASSVRDVTAVLDGYADALEGERRAIGAELLKEVRARLRFLTNVGLDYLSLDRKGPSLSGGESQRIQLASQLGSELSGVIYVLDEPSIGLHARDAAKLIDTLHELRDLGNTVIVVEHDRDTMEAADWIVDFGPGAGVNGGRVTAAAPPAELRKDPASLTGRYLSGRLTIAVPSARRKPRKGASLELKGARENNLKSVDVSFPLGLMTCVTGVSGAGKSTLINQVLLPEATRVINGSNPTVGDHDSLTGLELIDKVIAIDQKPIGRTPRSNPATYIKLWDLIRSFYAELPEARAFGFKPGRFSFNVKGGRCESCGGSGVKKVEMHFLPDVYVTCEDCCGRRFNEATCRVRYRGKDIADVLELTVDEALEHFSEHPKARKLLQTLADVGLGYIKLGQQSPTLSGGEAQRIKLARELGKRSTGRTLYVLDEPSTGLHFEDIKKLLAVLGRLVETGNTIIVIEHNMDIIKTADWIIDIGPEGGVGGGKVVAKGSPEQVARVARSHTGRFLAEALPKPSRKKARSR